jgi:hypothetical protein
MIRSSISWNKLIKQADAGCTVGYQPDSEEGRGSARR